MLLALNYSLVVITGNLFIPEFVSGWTLPIDVALSTMTILLPLLSALLEIQLFLANKENHNSMKFLTQTKSGNFSNDISI